MNDLPSCEACAAEGQDRPADEFDALCAAHRTAYDSDPDEADRIQGLIFGAVCEPDPDTPDADPGDPL